MMINFLIIVSCIFLSFNINKDISGNNKDDGDKKLRIINYNAFKAGEVIKYRLHYGFINAGTAKLEVKSTNLKVAGREIYHVIGTGRSNATFDLFFKVRDRYESYIDKNGVFPWLFIRRVNEGGYIIKQDYIFRQYDNIVKTQDGKVFKVPEYVQDMISAFYYARTIDFSNAKINQIYSVKTFLDDELFTLQMKFIGKDTIKVNKVKYSCLMFRPVVQEGRIFSSDKDLTVWVTNDENKIPVLAEAKILVGSIKMEITHYEGLANPIAIVE